MKAFNIVLSILCIFCATSARSQSFTVPHDTINATVTASSSLHNDMTNVSPDTIQIMWSVISHDFPTSWADNVGICDNNLCYYNTNNSLLNGNVKTTGPIAPGQTAIFYVLPSLTTADPGTHYLRVRMRQGSTTLDPIWIVNKWPTGVVTVTQSEDEVVIYPNPARDAITVLSSNPKIATVAMTDIFGKAIAVHGMDAKATKLDVSKLPGGLYVLRFMDANKNTVMTRKFLHDSN